MGGMVFNCSLEMPSTSVCHIKATYAGKSAYSDTNIALQFFPLEHRVEVEEGENFT